MPAVKLGVSRQVVIPNKLHDQLGLAPGDYLEVELERGKLVLTPKTLVDKQVEQGHFGGDCRRVSSVASLTIMGARTFGSVADFSVRRRVFDRFGIAPG